jgi:hypothetical protein
VNYKKIEAQFLISTRSVVTLIVHKNTIQSAIDLAYNKQSNVKVTHKMTYTYRPTAKKGSCWLCMAQRNFYVSVEAVSTVVKSRHIWQRGSVVRIIRRYYGRPEL